MRYITVLAFYGLHEQPQGAITRPYWDYTTLLHAPDYVPSCRLSNLVLEEDENAAGSLSFTIPISNPSINGYFDLGTIVEVRENDTSVPDGSSFDQRILTSGYSQWVGRVISIDIDTYGNKEVVCEGALAFLRDIVLVPGIAALKTDTLASFIAQMASMIEYTADANSTSVRFVRPRQLCFPVASSMIDLSKRITKLQTPLSNIPDYFTASPNYPSDPVIYYTGSIMTLLDFINEVLDNLGLYKAEGHDYGADYVYMKVYRVITPTVEDPNMFPLLPLSEPNYAELALCIDLSTENDRYPDDKPYIMFGDNLRSADISRESSSMITTLMAIGENYTDPLDGISKYYITTKDQASGTQSYYGYINSNKDSIYRYGILPGYIEVRDSKLNSADLVNGWANNFRSIAAYPKRELEVTASDLSVVDPTVSEIGLGQYFVIHFPGQRYDNQNLEEPAANILKIAAEEDTEERVLTLEEMEQLISGATVSYRYKIQGESEEHTGTVKPEIRKANDSFYLVNEGLFISLPIDDMVGKTLTDLNILFEMPIVINNCMTFGTNIVPVNITEANIHNDPRFWKSLGPMTYTLYSGASNIFNKTKYAYYDTIYSIGSGFSIRLDTGFARGFIRWDTSYSKSLEICYADDDEEQEEYDHDVNDEFLLYNENPNYNYIKAELNGENISKFCFSWKPVDEVLSKPVPDIDYHWYYPQYLGFFIRRFKLIYSSGGGWDPSGGSSGGGGGTDVKPGELPVEPYLPVYRCIRRKVDYLIPANSEYKFSYLIGENVSTISERNRISTQRKIDKQQTEIQALQKKVAELTDEVKALKKGDAENG